MYRGHLTRSGIQSSVVSVPCRYIHSHLSLLSTDDLRNSVRLVSAFIRNPASQ
ncbi:MAG: hypothetical protein ACTSSO_04910 [Candidatus Hodarchaeales archaeon]